MKIPKILDDVEINEEQIKALDTFFKEWHEEIESKVKATYVESSKDLISKKDGQKAFDIFYKEAEAAFNLAKKDYQEAFNLGIGDVKNQYTETMSKAMQDIYTDLELRVSEDFKKSPEYAAFESVKNAIAPVVMTEDQTAALKKLDEIKVREETILEDQKELGKQKAINTLLEDFPVEYKETVKKFIGKAITEEEVYERFNAMAEMIDHGGIKINEKKKSPKPVAKVEKKKGIKTKTILESKKVEKKVKTNKGKGKPIFESKTVEPKPVKEKKGKESYDDSLIALAFPQLG